MPTGSQFTARDDSFTSVERKLVHGLARMSNVSVEVFDNGLRVTQRGTPYEVTYQRNQGVADPRGSRNPGNSRNRRTGSLLPCRRLEGRLFQGRGAWVALKPSPTDLLAHSLDQYVQQGVGIAYATGANHLS